MKASSLTVAVCQMTSNDDVEANLMQMENLLERIPQEAGVRAVFFPENTLYTRLVEGETIVGLELHDESFRTLANIAKTRKFHLHLTTPIRIEEHVYNASVHINDSGEIHPTYQKMHLFDIALINGPSVRESDSFRHGAGLKTLEIDGWKFGQSICYDVRFAELYATYARQEVDVILVPSAFLVRTGEAHWEVLLRARAIESQAYVLAPAQAGVHRGLRGGVRETYGHSLIINPWGQVQVCLSESSPAIAIHSLQRDEIEKVRRQIPMKDHRRLPVSF